MPGWLLGGVSVSVEQAHPIEGEGPRDLRLRVRKLLHEALGLIDEAGGEADLGARLQEVIDRLDDESA